MSVSNVPASAARSVPKVGKRFADVLSPEVEQDIAAHFTVFLMDDPATRVGR